MTTPGNYPYAQLQALWGGVRDDIQNNVVGADTAALTAAQGRAEDGERRRRELASQMPGCGALLNLEQPPGGPGVGLSDVPGLEVAGEGYSLEAPVSAAQVASYGPERPVYADGLVGGVSFQAGTAEPLIPALRYSVSPGLQFPPAAVVPQARPGPLSRLAGAVRRLLGR